MGVVHFVSFFLLCVMKRVFKRRRYYALWRKNQLIQLPPSTFSVCAVM